MEPSYIFIKGSNLDNENKFVVYLIQNNNVEKVNFPKENKYFILNFKTDAKIESNIVKWTKFVRIKNYQIYTAENKNPTIFKEKSSISFMSMYKQLENNRLSWSILHFDYDIKLIEDG